jgi:hypothetical protein
MFFSWQSAFAVESRVFSCHAVDAYAADSMFFRELVL